MLEEWNPIRGSTNSMDFVTIATTGNGTDYGDLTATKRQGEGCSNGVRGIYMGGENDTPSTNTYNNVIDFCTIASIGNASDFGDLTAARDGGGSLFFTNSEFMLEDSLIKI